MESYLACVLRIGQSTGGFGVGGLNSPWSEPRVGFPAWFGSLQVVPAELAACGRVVQLGFSSPVSGLSLVSSFLFSGLPWWCGAPVPPSRKFLCL